MTREDILRMAREAHDELLSAGRGMHVWHDDSYAGDVQAFCERFAALVAAAEREECAKLCDITPPRPFRPSIEAAHAIRARGTK